MATDLFSPRKALTAHLEALVQQGVILGVGQAQDMADLLNGRQQKQHAFAYVSYDKSKNIKSKVNSITSTEVYTVILAWQNNRPDYSNQGQGMDDAGTVKAEIEFHVNGYTLSGERASKTTGKPFVISETPPEAFYRPQGWAFYPMAFEIQFTRTKGNRP